MHLDVETLERALHGELAAERDDAAFRHLEECAACAAALEDSRRREQRLFGLLEALDHEAPALDWGAVPAVEPSGGRSRLLVAASIAAVLGAGILYALPDSPLRSWIGGTGGEAASPDAPTGAGGPRSVSGVSIRPTAAFEIALAGSQDSGWVRVEVADGPEVEIRVLGAPVDFTSGPDRVTIENRGSRSSYAIRLPVTGPEITIRVGGETILVASVEGIRTAAPRTESGSYRIDLAHPPLPWRPDVD